MILSNASTVARLFIPWAFPASFLFLACVANPAGFRLERVALIPDDRLEISFAAEPDSYYRLLRGAAVTSIREVVGIGFQGPLATPAAGEAGFVRVQRVLRSDSFDSDGDGLPDVFELERPVFNPLLAADAGRDFDGDGVSNRDEFLRGTDPLQAEPRLTTLTSSPLNGDDGVAVTRETVLRFSRPLAADTLLDHSRFFAEAAGRKVLSRFELSPDRRKATLFYLEPLPGATRIRVSFDASAIKDSDGKLVDADGDGAEGGVAWIEFDTLNNQPVPGTAVIGRVFASELVAGPDTGTNAINRPLKGATITVDGMEETLRAVTDAEGNFKLTNAPAGRFFVHVDGRTAEGSQWPDGDYYPFVGKAWEAVAGRQDNLAGGTGEIYLPLIEAGSLKAVSALGPTYVAFPPAVVAANPALAGVALMVPANALADDNGTRGGRVGIAPVPPDRLPEALPDGLKFPLVITVQTDGPRNFAEPVPVCFPNLPDPATGRALPPGAKSALWSFDHDKGYWEIAGPMTVSADGRLVCSDPGTGITQPGWHGTLPGTSGSGGRSTEPRRCAVAVLGPNSTYTNRWASFTTTTASQGGVWSWSAPGGEPSSGMGESFQVRYQREGTYRISVRYTTPNGRTQCQAEHSLRVTHLPCEISVTGPNRTPLDLWTRYRAEGTPTGGKYQWTVEGRGLVQAVGGGDATGPEIEASWSDLGDFKLAVEYTAKPGTADEQKCRAEKLVTVSNALRILDNEGREVGPATFLELDDQAFWHGNLSEGEGDYQWTAGADVQIEGPTDQVAGLTFTRPGVRTVTVTYTPYQAGERPQTRSVTVRVRDVCEIMVLDDIRQDLPPNTPILFEAQTQPASGGTVRWRAPGGSPSTGTGRRFTTEYATKGPKRIDVSFTNPNGDLCESAADLHIGPIDCRLTVLGPSSLSVVDGFVYEAKGNGSAAETYSATLVETGESLGSGAPGAGNAFKFLFAPALLRPGPYTIRVHYSALFFDIFDGECTHEFPVTVLPATAGLSRSVRLHGADQPEENQPAPGRHLFARVNLANGTITRGFTAANGVAHPVPVRLPADTLFRQHLLHAENFMIATAEFRTPAEGRAFEFPEFVFQPDPGPDGDGDGLTDFAESIAGSDPAKADTDGDGVTDAAEVRAGTSPTGADSTGPALLAGAATGGYAWDVCLDGQRALVAAGDAGLAVFNVLNPARPVLIGRADTPGDARAVACAGDVAAVADGAAGLALVDLTAVPSLVVNRQLPLGAPVNAVAAQGGLVFAGLDTGAVVMLDAASGAELRRREVGGGIEDLMVRDRWVHALSVQQGELKLYTLEVTGGNLETRQELTLTGSRGAGGRRLRLLAGADRLFVVFTQGYHVLRQDDPQNPARLGTAITTQAGWRHFGLTAGGLLVAAADPNSTDDGAHDVQLHRLAADGISPVFDLQLPTPGSAEAVSLRDELAYVADGPAGLQVLRFQDADRAGRAPTVEVRASVPGPRVQANERVTFTAVATDDVAVARVDFELDGVPVASDSSFPFELVLAAPQRSLDRETLRVRARATDTGGNVGVSPELVLQLADDATAPVVTGTSPESGSEIATALVDTLVVSFSEVIEPSSLTPANFLLTYAGPDNQFGTADDAPVAGGVVEHRAAEATARLRFAAPLNTGRYRAQVGPGIADPAGNINPTVHEWGFRLIGPKVISSVPRSYGSSAGYETRVRFSRAMNAASVAAAWKILGLGPDGSPNTADDEIMPGEVTLEAGGTVAVFRFAQPLVPGQYLVRLDQTATDEAGRALHEAWDTYFNASELTYGSGVRWEGNLGDLLSANEFRLVFPSPVDLVVVNQNRQEVSLTRPDGTVVATSSDRVFDIAVPQAGTYVFRITRSEAGQPTAYAVGLFDRQLQSFAYDLNGQSSIAIEGRAERLAPGDVDEWRLTTEPGARYRLRLQTADDWCDMQWSLYAPAGNALVLKRAGCEDAFVFSSSTGGVYRLVVTPTIPQGVAPRFEIRRGETRSFARDLSAADQYRGADDPEVEGGFLEPADALRFVFNLAAGQRWSFQPLTPECWMGWELRAPDGGVVFAQDCPTIQQILSGTGGEFQLLMFNRGSFRTSGPMLEAYRVLTRAFAHDLGTGGVVRVTEAIPGVGSRHVHEFRVAAGQPVAFSDSGRGPGLEWELRDPAGRIVFGPERSRQVGAYRIENPLTGAYRLTFTATPQLRGQYGFAAGIPRTLTTAHDLVAESNLVQNLDLPLPGSVRVLELQLAAAEPVRLRLEALEEECTESTLVSLQAPDGEVLFSLPLSGCSLVRDFVTATAGFYRVTVSIPPDASPEPVRIDIRRGSTGDGGEG